MADIVLKDRNGNPVQYPGVEKIKVNTVDGETVEFVDSGAIPAVVEDIPITLDFSVGDQEIIAPDGVVVKSATIQKPDTLIPENIAEGVDIAGIIGTLANMGVAWVGKSGQDTQNLTTRTITHNLGVVPDCIIMHIGQTGSNPTSQLRFVIAYNAKFAKFVGQSRAYQKYLTSTLINVSTTDFTGSAGAPINNANETSFTVGNNVSLVAGTQYSWYVIGGLT